LAGTGQKTNNYRAPGDGKGEFKEKPKKNCPHSKGGKRWKEEKIQVTKN